MRGIFLGLLLVSPAAAAASKGKVSVLYAGSLVDLMEKDLGPAFEKATGLEFEGEGRGSVALARMIKDGLRDPDVFVSADPKVDELLMGAANGDRVRWYATAFGGALVVGYGPRSRFAPLFAKAAAGKAPVYEALEAEGLRLGRTDPKLDPKGYRTILAFDLAERFFRRPGLSRKVLGEPENPDQVFPEEDLEARLEVGQLDAGIFYRNEVRERGLPFVALPREIDLGEPALEKSYAAAVYTDAAGKTHRGGAILYTITVLEGAPHREAALAFARFVLSAQGRRLLEKHGLRPVAPVFTGRAPDELRSAR